MDGALISSEGERIPDFSSIVAVKIVFASRCGRMEAARVGQDGQLTDLRFEISDRRSEISGSGFRGGGHDVRCVGQDAR